MTPILVRARSTNRWYVYVRYRTIKQVNPATGLIEKAYQAITSYDITDQMRTILTAERAKAKAAA